MSLPFFSSASRSNLVTRNEPIPKRTSSALIPTKYRIRAYVPQSHRGNRAVAAGLSPLPADSGAKDRLGSGAVRVKVARCQASGDKSGSGVRGPQATQTGRDNIMARTPVQIL